MMKYIKYLKIPTPAAILFVLLFFGTSFYSGIAYTKSKTGDVLGAKSVFTVDKTEKPNFDFYVMSFCPYGNQIEDVIKPVAELLGDKADIRPRYIFEKIEGGLSNYCGPNRVGDPNFCSNYVSSGYFTDIDSCKKAIEENKKTCADESNYIKASESVYYSSLHGRVEANQNVREICAYNIAQDKNMWWNFVDNVNKNCNQQDADTCWEDQAKAVGYDTNEITKCFNEQGISLIEKEIEKTTANNVTGSPTLFVNNAKFPPEEAYIQDGSGTLKIGKTVVNQNDFRSANTLKEAVCAAFKKAPKECKTTLSSEAASGGTAASAASSCN
ncbi:MAG: DsbA family protein [Patescibacteria group bacterium]|jgi:hypothetical protein